MVINMTEHDLDWCVYYYCKKTTKIVKVIKFLTQKEAQALANKLQWSYSFFIRFSANARKTNSIDHSRLTDNARKMYNNKFSKSLLLKRKINSF